MPRARGRLACDLGHLRRLRGANALEGDAGLLLDVGDEALLLAVHQRDRHARAARAARAPAAVDVRLGVLSSAADVKTGVPRHPVQALCIEKVHTALLKGTGVVEEHGLTCRMTT